MNKTEQVVDPPIQTSEMLFMLRTYYEMKMKDEMLNVNTISPV